MRNNPRSTPLSRRDTLKVCLLPASVVTARWLVGCSSGDHTGGNANEGTGGGNPIGNGGAAPNAAGTASTSSGGTSVAPGAGGQLPASAGGSPITSGTGGSAPAGAAGATTGAGGATGSAGGATTGAGGGGASSVGGATGTAGSAGAGANVPWATGGTKSIKGGYPDPFGSSAGSSCIIYPAQTIGPCYANSPMMRSDISDGLDGLPMRMSLLVVRANCMPVTNATVDVWHSGSDGIYSAYATGTVCNPGMDNVLMKTFCRGVQATDENGRVDFDTVFPGWYKGRTIHIHFTVRIGTQVSVTSQLYFDDSLSDEILAQGKYATRGKRDTNNTTDNLFTSGGAKPAQVLFSWAKRSDGVLHAWKVLSIG